MSRAIPAFLMAIAQMPMPALALQIPSSKPAGYFEYCDAGYCMKASRVLYCTTAELQAFPNLSSTTADKPYRRPGNFWYYVFKSGIGGTNDLPPSCAEVYNVSGDPAKPGADPKDEILAKHPGAMSLTWYHGIDMGVGMWHCPTILTRGITIYYTPPGAVAPPPSTTPNPNPYNPKTSGTVPGFDGVASGRMSDGRTAGAGVTGRTSFAPATSSTFCNRGGRSKLMVENCIKATRD